MFQLIFKGECAAGTAPAAARNSARQLFKASDAQLDRMFNGQPVVIRNDLDQAQAEKYRAVLQKHGMRTYVQAMAAAPARSTSTPKPVARPAPQGQQQSAKVDSKGGLPIAGERTDAVLAGSSLTLDPPGVTLAKPRPVQPRHFENLGAWSVAPSGSNIGSKEELPPPTVPDTSHLELQPLPPVESDR